MQGNSLFPVKPFLVLFDLTGKPAMGRIEKTVFISYRRTNASWALAVFQNLKHHGYDVFFDFDGIASGDFESVILGNIYARAHFILVLTPSALERCSEPDDWLRREIETAMQAKRNIIPLMLEGFKFSTPAIASQLIGALEPLRHYNAVNIPTDYFDEAMERLRERFLNIALDAVLHPASLHAQQTAKIQQAAADAASEVHEDELTAQTYFERGFSAVDPDEGIRFYTEAIRLKPDYADAYNNRGVARVDKGDVEGALGDYEEAIRLKPDCTDAYNNRGNVRTAKGDVEGALRDYEEAIRLKPDYVAAYLGRGLVRASKGDLEAALGDFEEAIRLKPDDALAYFGCGAARAEKGDAEGALRDFEEAIRLKPDNASAYVGRGNARRVKGDVEGALRDYEEAIRLKPELASAYVSRGNARVEKGDVEGALGDYEEAIRLEPDDAWTYHNRAVLKEHRSEHRDAIADFQKYLDLGGAKRGGDQAQVEKFIRDLKAKL
jgi:tetratricopeptide (TPR) repeat protein